MSSQKRLFLYWNVSTRNDKMLRRCRATTDLFELLNRAAEVQLGVVVQSREQREEMKIKEDAL